MSATRHASRRPVFSVPRPGPIWGDYPQRAERADAIDRVVRRRRPSLDPRRVAQQAQQLIGRADWPTGPEPIQRIAMRLIRLGWVERAVVPALALAAKAMAATVGWSPELNQLHCAAVLLDGRLAQMDTGEGKTCSAALAAAVAALAGTPVHVLTANDYLAQRDLQRLAPMFGALGLTCAVAREDAPPEQRRQAYQALVVYATARCVAFDYLRDRTSQASVCASTSLGETANQPDPSSAGTPLLRGLCVAIIDEADSILIDEARVPLILAESRTDPSARARVWRALDLARRLIDGIDFVSRDSDRGGLKLTDAGKDKVQVESIAYGGLWQHPLHRVQLIEQALQALHGLRRDVDYLVSDQAVVIVDQVSGRPAAERNWSGDLHALVALKERVALPDDSVTRASITYPRLFARYHHVGGLSGTLDDARRELAQQYGLSVSRVPRIRPLRRQTMPMRLFADRSAQFDAAVARAGELAEQGRAVLLVTDSVTDTQELAQRSERSGLSVALLSARHDQAEAEIVAAAGSPGKVTVATQMAGRGTDIELAPSVLAQGGLHIVNLQHNRSRRVDRQVEGRAGRRGDPGSVEHWVRLQQSPLAPDQVGFWFGPLVWLSRVCAERYGDEDPPVTVPRLSRFRSVLARALLGCFQTWSGLEDRLQRARLVKADRGWARALHFAGVKE